MLCSESEREMVLFVFLKKKKREKVDGHGGDWGA